MFITKQTFQSEKAQLEHCKSICETKTQIADYPLATQVENNVLIYQGDDIRASLTESGSDNQQKIDWLNEFHRALKEGPGVVVIKKFYSDSSLMDKGTEVFKSIIQAEALQSKDQGDHFSQGSPNSRIWNVVEKLLDADPDYFYHYFKNPLISLIAQSWLGPAYKMTAQVNLVRPGSKSQVAHRDYHLGFLDDDVIVRYPLNSQVISQYLTLQGAIAHCDMPLESGPTLLLPHSQKFEMGYSTMRRPEFINYFNENKVQNPLEKGDAVFFSPALFHAAGENRSENLERMANLLQISSSFGIPMEKVDLVSTARKIYPVLLEKLEENQTRESQTELNEEIESVIEITVAAYPFPSNLDVMNPKPGSLTPASDQDVLRKHLLKKSTPEIFNQALKDNQV